MKSAMRKSCLRAYSRMARRWLPTYCCAVETLKHGVYRSLHNLDTGDVSIETADEFIRHMGNGYVAWRYILTEDNKRMPKVHLGMMLESWRALADLVQHSI